MIESCLTDNFHDAPGWGGPLTRSPDMKTIHAVFENGVFRPTEPVDLPDGSEVTVEPLKVEKAPNGVYLDRIHEILSRSYDTGDPYLSERHDEHQP